MSLRMRPVGLRIWNWRLPGWDWVVEEVDEGQFRGITAMLQVVEVWLLAMYSERVKKRCKGG